MAISPDSGEKRRTRALDKGVPFYGNCAVRLGAKAISERRRAGVQSGYARCETPSGVAQICRFDAGNSTLGIETGDAGAPIAATAQFRAESMRGSWLKRFAQAAGCSTSRHGPR